MLIIETYEQKHEQKSFLDRMTTIYFPEKISSL